MPATRLSARVMARLVQAEACELDPHCRDDLRIARLIVRYAATGEAVLCSPHELASYMVLGLHPSKVWPAIQARRNALGLMDVWAAPPVPKKPAQAVRLWTEKTNAARTAILGGGKTLLRDNTISVPMAAPSIAALFSNPDQSSSAKTREFTLEELKWIVSRSGADHSIRALTISALCARGDWPNQKGPATTVLSVAILGMMFEGACCRSTVQRRIKRAVKLGYWRRLRDANTWTDCPKCHAKRTSGKCTAEGCDYHGRSKDDKGNWTGEFMRVPVYEFDAQKFRSAPRCREIRQFDARSYAEYKAAAKRGEYPNLAVMPGNKPAEDAPSPKSPTPARREERKTAEHQKVRTVVETEITQRATKAAQLMMEMCGLADIGAIPQIAISIAAEAKYRGIEIEEAAQFVGECATRDQKNGIALTRFYFRDLKWRSSDGRQTSAAQQRADHNKRSILNGFARNARDPDPPDGPERKGDTG